jgi:hypothetical protein
VSDDEKGLYNKYEVQRLHDQVGKHDQCEYFVLDLKHDPFAKTALAVYAVQCKDKYPALYEDLIRIVFDD